MAFPTRVGMTFEQFRDEIIEHFFPHYRVGTSNPNGTVKTPANPGLADDFAKIGAFLSDPDKVKAGLVGLENDIRNYLVCTAPDVRAKVETYTAVAAKFKANKVLSNCLVRQEMEEGFNNPTDYGTAENMGVFHSTTSFGVGRDEYNMAPTGRKGLQGAPDSPIQKPKGAPTVAGFGLDGKDFNRTLLAHGYQFKDVGAGPDHGEFTHRLQWSAICHAIKLGDLTLANAPIALFKRMGGLDSGASANLSGGMHLYIWEALFDNFRTEQNARNNGTMAWSADTFNAPENMNLELVKVRPGAENAFSETAVGNLFCLRVLLNLRFKKRKIQAQQELDGTANYLDKLYVDNGRTKAVTAASSSNVVALSNRDTKLTSAIFWYMD